MSWWQNQEPRMLFGMILMIMLVALAATVALGHVHQDSSYGLDYILGSLSTMAGAFGQWAFGNKTKKDEGQGEK